MFARDCLEEFRVECDLRRLSPRTTKGYYNNTALFLNYLEKHMGLTDLEAMEAPHIKKYMQYLIGKGLSPSYINGILKSLRAHFKYALSEGYLAVNPAAKINWQREGKVIIETFTDEEVKSLLNAFDLTSYLESLNGNRFCIVGGENAVPASLETSIKAYGETTRLAGKDRLVTSVMVAQKYFSNPDSAVVAYGWNYPDGLCGGPLAYAMDAPLILTYSKPSLYATAVNYTNPLGIKSGYILGGEGLVYDEAVRAIFSMTEADSITAK